MSRTVRTFEEIENDQKSFGSLLEETRGSHGLTRDKLAEYVVLLGSREAKAWRKQLDSKIIKIEEEIERSKAILEEFEALQKVDKDTIKNWENNKPVPSVAAVKILAEVFYDKPEQQTEKEEFIKLADDTRKALAMQQCRVFSTKIHWAQKLQR